MKNAMTADQSAILQQFLSLPDPTYAEIFETQAERDELQEQLEIKTSDFDALQDDLKDSEREKDNLQGRIYELEAALADALSWIATDNGAHGMADFAHENTEYLRLYKIL